MKHVKKLCALALASVTLCSALAGCGAGSDKKGATATDNIVEFVYNGWNNIPITSDYATNPYKKYVDETYGFDFRVSLTSDFKNEVSKRLSSTKTRLPDVIVFSVADYATMKSFYNQGFFVEDYTPYFNDLPRYKELFETNVAAKAKLTENNHIIALTRPKDKPVWMHKINRTWVEKYANGKIPETVDELLAMAANAKADSKPNEEKYLFTSSGDNKNLGNIRFFQFMFGEHDSWYVENGQVSHPILDGTHEKFLQFCRTIYEEGYIHPDFYTQNWQAKRNALLHDRVGIDWYAPAIATEQTFYNKDDESLTEIWANLPMPSDTAGVERKAAAYETFQQLYVINKDVVKNEKKFASLLKFLNEMLYPEDESERAESLYMKLRWGVDVDGYEIGAGKEMEPVLDKNGNDTGFVTYYYQLNAANHTRTNNGGTWDYGVPMATTDDKVVEYLGAKKYGQSAYDYIELFNGALEYYETHANFNYGEMVNLSSKIEGRLEDLLNEFEITYIMSTTSMTYEQFKAQWLQYGGETAKKSVEAQFRAAGLL